MIDTLKLFANRHFSSPNPSSLSPTLKSHVSSIQKKLGFTVAFIYGEPPFYAQVFRDGARLNLRSLPESAINTGLRDREHLLSATITLHDAEPLFLEFQAAGVVFHQTLKSEPWGARTFIVGDPDGNLILFAGRGQ